MIAPSDKIQCDDCGDNDLALDEQCGKDGWYRCNCGLLHRPFNEWELKAGQVWVDARDHIDSYGEDPPIHWYWRMKAYEAMSWMERHPKVCGGVAAILGLIGGVVVGYFI